MTSLQEWVQERLTKESLTAAEVMDLALYHPAFGYYRQPEGRWGFENKDYYTALDCGSLLGETLALRLEQHWQSLGAPTRYTILEPGGGRGWLGRDILTHASPIFSKVLRYVHRDDSPAAQIEAARVLQPWIEKGSAQITSSLDEIDPIEGCIFSNELFDALPAQPWRWHNQQWEQEVLTLKGPEWRASSKPAESHPPLAWFASQAKTLEEGDGSVWCEALPQMIQSLDARIHRGLFLAIDYGETADRLLAKGADLRRYKSHTVDGRWWEELGSCDLTADVDFTRLMLLLKERDWSLMDLQSLSMWIRQHAPLEHWSETWENLSSANQHQKKENLLQLTLPNLLGERFRVLEAHKGASN